jgi:integrase
VNLNGEAIGDIKKGFAAACARAGLKGVTPHTLRHTCATWLMQAGVNKWEAAGFLGMSMETLERVYGHHHPDHLSEAASAFSRRPRNVRATPQ